MKKYTFLIISLSILVSAFPFQLTAQQAKETTAKLDKVKHPVFKIVYTYPTDMVEGAIMKKLKEDKISAKQKRHSITSQGEIFPELSNSPLDIYFLTERKGRKKDSMTTLKMFVSKGKDHFIGKKTDQLLAQKSLYFLDHLTQDIHFYTLQEKIELKEKELKKAKKDYSKLIKQKRKYSSKLLKRKKERNTSTGKDMKKANRKIKKLNKKLHKNSSELNKAERDLDHRKGELQALRRQLSIRDNF